MNDKKSMRVHFSNKYQGLKTSENSQEYTIQMSFRSKLRKYIQVNEYEIMLRWLICFYLRNLKMEAELNSDSELDSNSEDSEQSQ